MKEFVRTTSNSSFSATLIFQYVNILLILYKTGKNISRCLEIDIQMKHDFTLISNIISHNLLQIQVVEISQC